MTAKEVLERMARKVWEEDVMGEVDGDPIKDYSALVKTALRELVKEHCPVAYTIEPTPKWQVRNKLALAQAVLDITELEL